MSSHRDHRRTSSARTVPGQGRSPARDDLLAGHLLAQAASRVDPHRARHVSARDMLHLQRSAGNRACASLASVQRNIVSGQAANQDWSPRSVPKAVKQWGAGQAAPLGPQYRTTLGNMAQSTLDQGDGVLAYLNGWNHKRFAGQYCLLYVWAQRRDGRGWFLKVKGIGRKNGAGNDYSQIA